MSLRIAMDGRSLAAPVPRGMDRYLLGLIPELARLGVQITLFHRAGEPIHANHLRGLPCRTLALKSPRTIAWEQLAVPAALARGGFDLYHAPAERGVPYAASCPVVYTLHSATHRSYADLVQRELLPGPVERYLGEDPPQRHRWFFDRYYDGQVRRAAHVLTPSEFSRGEIVRLMRVNPDRITATPLAADPAFERPRRDDDSINQTLARLGVNPPYLLNVGGYEPHKNIEGLLKAFAISSRSHPLGSLVIVGSKVVPQTVRDTCESLGIAARVELLSNVTDDLIDLYDAADALVTLSWRESFCLPLLEAMKRGVPCVASEWGAAPQVLGGAGLLVDPREPSIAAAAIAMLIDDDALRASLIARGRERAAQFSWRATALQTLAVYTRLLGRS